MSNSSGSPQIPVGAVVLTVSNLPKELDFYRDTLGLQVHRQDGHSAALGAGGDDLVILEERSGAKPPGRTTGLYHLALLLPSRAALGRQLRRLMDRGTPLQGVADHLVSEAIYLADPEGNGIELYRDRPREEWAYDSGNIRMATDPLDVAAVLSEAAGHPGDGQRLPAETVMGHVHLRVADLAAAESFYRDVLGLDLTTRFGRSASFLSYEGYHHHIGVNTWESQGATPSPVGSPGLKQFQLRVPGRERWNRIQSAIGAGSLAAEALPEGWLVRDPSGNGIMISPLPGK